MDIFKFYILNNLNCQFDLITYFFLFIILLVALPSLLYASAYLRGHYSSRKIIWCQALTVGFIVAMAGVVSAGNIVTFLLAWELMTLISYLLIVGEPENLQAARAGVIYLVMAHLGTAMLLAAFLVLYQQLGTMDFTAMKQSISLLTPGTLNLLFLLFFFGFAAKAGVVPLHIWLPYAHPEAPSQVSALMSGVMIKTALYGMVRFIFFLLGVQALWWGLLVVGLAALSALVGAIYALIENDLKKILAYCSIENIGIILFGFGSAMIFAYYQLSYLTVLALAAGLYHLLNHAVFKALLFLSAGSVIRAVQLRNIEQMGGLIKRLPWTAGMFLLGALGIAGLPPLNGFVSEWLTFQALFMGAGQMVSGEMKLFFGLAVALLAATSGLSAAGFVKAFGITFLARSRSTAAAAAGEVPAAMLAAQGWLAALVIILGLGAPLIFPLITQVAGQAAGLSVGVVFPITGQAAVSPVGLAFLLILFPLITAGLFLIFGRKNVAVSGTWDCGYYQLSARNEFTGTGLSKPFRIAYSFFLQPYRKMAKIRTAHYHVSSLHYETKTKKVFMAYFYDKLVGFVFHNANLFKRFQAGSVHIYLGYLFFVLLLLLTVWRFI
ncbi:hypothetical protein A2311_03405 [candidate division WOR-1 bacterium RIFOXYB2_FULL_48_7]|uniref:NADH:quinone oxidoreductase/Mrp antiporter transmembrane domain-containing protein n=1 Tax=candidate division WOR-1 bacterium RIFOXYB2_FULL_48_7 TaxID=1802583 RepID=A0A1F4TRT2_UNCSA|nr:MAG: hypothetical protein A2311_03405 [candidate division WOR-1 bacterium RIFOXYB2_FULL_48_7]